MRAPARYSAMRGPGTFDTTTLATDGMLSASRERPYMDTSALINHGTPRLGNSVGITDFTFDTVFFILAVALTMARMRSAGSAISLHSESSIMLTWLFKLVSPSARRLTG